MVLREQQLAHCMELFAYGAFKDHTAAGLSDNDLAIDDKHTGRELRFVFGDIEKALVSHMLLRQYLHFCTSTANKLSTLRSDNLTSPINAKGLLPPPAESSP